LHIVDLDTKKEIRTKILDFTKKFKDLEYIEHNDILSKNGGATGAHHLHLIKKKIQEIDADFKRIE